MTTQQDQGSAGQDTPNSDEGAKIDPKLAEVIAERDKLARQLRDLAPDMQALKTLRKQVEDLTVEKSTLANSFEAFKQATRQRELDTHVSTALEAAGAKNSATVKKLLDMSKVKVGDDGQVVQESIVELIKGVRESDPYLFKEVEPDPKSQSSSSATAPLSAPAVKRAEGSPSQTGFEVELEAAKKLKGEAAHKAISAVLKKYGKIN